MDGRALPRGCEGRIPCGFSRVDRATRGTGRRRWRRRRQGLFDAIIACSERTNALFGRCVEGLDWCMSHNGLAATHPTSTTINPCSQLCSEDESALVCAVSCALITSTSLDSLTQILLGRASGHDIQPFVDGWLAGGEWEAEDWRERMRSLLRASRCGFHVDGKDGGKFALFFDAHVGPTACPCRPVHFPSASGDTNCSLMRIGFYFLVQYFTMIGSRDLQITASKKQEDESRRRPKKDARVGSQVGHW